MSDIHNPWPDEGNTGHIWDDDLRELDNPPPLWWMLSFYASILVLIFYVIYYPALPLIDSHTKGVGGWTQIQEYHEDFQVLRDWRARNFAEEEEKLATLSVEEILRDEDLTAYVIKTSRMLFGDYCMACHGALGQGISNFPVLADDDWLFGGDVNSIKVSIAQGRVGSMPARGLLGNLTDEDIEHLTDYMFALTTGDGDNPEFALGRAAYDKGMCMACHGPLGTPIGPTGAANLADHIWRFKSDRETVWNVLAYGVNVKVDGRYLPKTQRAVMPGFHERLPDAEVNIKRLAVYVHQLGGGQ